MEKKLYSKKRCTASFFAIPGAWSTFQAPGRNSARARQPPVPLPALGATLRQVPARPHRTRKKEAVQPLFFGPLPRRRREIQRAPAVRLRRSPRWAHRCGRYRRGPTGPECRTARPGPAGRTLRNRGRRTPSAGKNRKEFPGAGSRTGPRPQGAPRPVAGRSAPTRAAAGRGAAPCARETGTRPSAPPGAGRRAGGSNSRRPGGAAAPRTWAAAGRGTAARCGTWRSR